MPTVEVEWNTEADDGGQRDLPPQYVNVPDRIYDEEATNPGWDDPVSEWLSNMHGYLAKSWQLKGCNYQ